MDARAPQLGRWLRLGAMALAMACAPAAARQALNRLPEAMQDVGVDDRTGERIPLDVRLTDSSGQPVTVGKYFQDGRPVVLLLAYYDCPLACPLMLQRLNDGLNSTDFTVGREFNVIVVSFDPGNTTRMAADARRLALGGYHQPVTESVRAGWEFHTAEEAEVRRLAAAVGYKYKYIEAQDEYSHPTALVVLTPEGVVSRYIHGFDVRGRDLKLALLEASEGKVARTLGDLFLHFCYRYDARAGSYSLQAMAVMKIGAVVSMLAVGGLILALKLGERARSRRRLAAPAVAAPPGSTEPSVPPPARARRTPGRRPARIARHESSRRMNP